MEKAANFYTAYLTSDDSSVLLSPAIQSAIDGQLQVLKKQISYKRYIVTEIIPNDRRPTRKQDQLITKPTKDFMDVKELLEYEDYVQKPTYDEMLRRIEPEKIICYNTPFPEMQGNIIYVDYERSFRGEDLDAFKIGSTSSGDRDTIEPYLIGKGGGSAYGADWKPNPKKPNDWKFLGNPGDINQTYNKHGELYETHIGPDGKADYEIHHSDHGNPGEHVNPHAHEIIWTPTGPSFNPMDMPLKRFIQRKEIVSMTPLIPANTPEQNQFVSISDFKWCVDKGGEIDFIWDGKEYGISHSRGRIIAYLWGQPDTTQYFATADDVLNYMVGSDRLRDVITQVTVLDRTI